MLWVLRLELPQHTHNICFIEKYGKLFLDYLQANTHLQRTCSSANAYRKNPKNSDTRKIAVIILKFEQYHFTTE